MYYRSLLYTAITRAKKLLIILGSASAVKTMVDNHKTFAPVYESALPARRGVRWLTRFGSRY